MLIGDAYKFKGGTLFKSSVEKEWCIFSSIDMFINSEKLQFSCYLVFFGDVRGG